jgi:hypothetical protein
MMLRPPNIMGLCTYTKSRRNFNIVEKDATGKFSSTSRVSTYKLTATEYSETLLFHIVNNQIGGKDIVYDLSGQTGSAPVTVEAGRIQFKAPLSTSQRSYVFEGNKWTSTNAEGSMDVWEDVPKGAAGVWCDAFPSPSSTIAHALRIRHGHRTPLIGRS